MARFRRSVAGRTRSWFLLKDCVIFVIVMYVLPPFYNNTKLYAMDDATFLNNDKETKDKLQQQQQQQQQTKIDVNKSYYENLSANSFRNLMKSTEMTIHKEDNNNNNNSNNNNGNNLDKNQTAHITVSHKITNKTQKNNVSNTSPTILIPTPTTTSTIITNKRLRLSNHLMAATAAGAPTTVTGNDDGFGLRENVVIPSKDPEREAQLLYEKSLKEFHSTFLESDQQEQQQHGITTSANSSSLNTQHVNVNVERNVRAVCELWSIKHCHCTGTLGRLSLSCRNIGVLVVPVDLPSDTVILDLGNNNITKLEANTFFMAVNLEELTLADNSLSIVDPLAFYGLTKLKRLNLQNCGLKSLTANAFQGLTNLISLQLNGNALASMDSNSLQNLSKLRTLRLESNLFYRIPGNALTGLQTLEALNLGSNLLTIINDDDFPHMPNLVVLLLKRNQIMKITVGAFKNLTALKVLELDDNLINALPEGLRKLTHLQEFSLTSNRLRWINDSDLPKTLQVVDLRANPISRIMPSAFKGMNKLRKLILSDVRFLKDFPNLEGCLALEVLKLDRAGLTEVPSYICRHSPRLRSLELKTNVIEHIPALANCRELRLLDLSNNHIEHLHGRPFHGLKKLDDLLLSYNRIKSVPHDAFHGINKLQLLDLEGNQINFIHKDAFLAISNLEDLNLGNNIFPELPSRGVQRLLHLKTFNNPKLKDFPPPETFPRIQTLILSYAYHCCPFIPLVVSSASKKPPLVQEAVLFPSDADFDMTLWNNSMLDIWPQLHNLSKKFGPQMYDIWDNFAQGSVYSKNMPTYMEEYFEEEPASASAVPTSYAANFGGGNLFATQLPEHNPDSIQCLPMPGPFLPCTDLFDWWTLRCGVWVVFLLALLGNGTVVFVLLFSRSKIDVPRFLVCNLAAADFFMGIYLGILAMVDASTLGEFRMFAIPWQMSIVCQIAGFLAVLSSELSVYTLAVITLERNYAITHAIYLNKRLSLKQAGYIMAVGWSFALIMAILPLVGVSDYRKFAVCLPFETTTGLASLTYVIALMIINGCAFLTLMGCYLKMYWAIRGSQAWNTNDSRIAKRMALLVFTDFLCWSPIAFFSITAIFGLQLISLEQAKIFTVFILPLNSCCNPFLYAIMTKQFKKDCVTLCKHFEETRVTRGATAGLTRRALGTERLPKDLPPLLPLVHPPGCRCLRMLPGEMPNWHRMEEKGNSTWSRSWQHLLECCSCYVCCSCCYQRSKRRHKMEGRKSRGMRGQKTDPYQYQFAEIKQKKETRTGSISSENFCSSRSSSWRNGGAASTHKLRHGHTCNIPLKVMEANHRKHSAWLITRKTSQDSNLSSSRNDSSASATTASTSTFRLSRSSGGSSTPLPTNNYTNKTQPHQFNANLPKPRLVRQEAVQEEEDSSTPPRLGVRYLPTIPSAADSSVIMEDGDSALGGNGSNGGGVANFYDNLELNSASSSPKSIPSVPSVTAPPQILPAETKDYQPP